MVWLSPVRGRRVRRVGVAGYRPRGLSRIRWVKRIVVKRIVPDVKGHSFGWKRLISAD